MKRLMSASRVILTTSLACVLLMPAQISAQAVTAASTAVTNPASGFMVPKVAKLRATTPSETRADLVWNLRAALNVAALQCQFSPYLRTVSNYNEVLRHHANELNTTMTIMKAHFRRHDGARGVNSFDQYTTRTYNSFSTLDAQYSFCEAAAQIGREVLTLRRGQLSDAASQHIAALRASLLPRETLALYGIYPLAPMQLAQIDEPQERRRRR